MSTTLLMQIVGKQWWNTNKYSVSPTDPGREPTKAGIIDMICTVMLTRHEATISKLAECNFIVRHDNDGIMMRDFVNRTLSHDNYYLYNAAFLVALTGDLQILVQAYAALKNMQKHISFGRKFYKPDAEVAIGLKSEISPLSLVINHPLIGGNGQPRKVLISETVEESKIVRLDNPIVSDYGYVIYGERFLKQSMYVCK